MSAAGFILTIVRGFGTLAAWRITQRGVAMVQCPQHSAKIVGMPIVATKIKASIAACNSGASCSVFGSFVMQVHVSSNVTSWRPRAGEQDRRRGNSKTLPVVASLKAGSCELTGAFAFA